MSLCGGFASLLPADPRLEGVTHNVNAYSAAFNRLQEDFRTSDTLQPPVTPPPLLHRVEAKSVVVEVSVEGVSVSFRGDSGALLDIPVSLDEARLAVPALLRASLLGHRRLRLALRAPRLGQALTWASLVATLELALLLPAAALPLGVADEAVEGRSGWDALRSAQGLAAPNVRRVLATFAGLADSSDPLFRPVWWGLNQTLLDSPQFKSPSSLAALLFTLCSLGKW